ncbi:hypothetical protein HNR42_003126 [Deinobacterium chartae]|uniref:Uncharacterized protein n=1 Tax=Deinobacterium chartae TaxID=521158 RepID=A0A841I5E3_9DEIO|nr:hypothetical protein [Deinobacterium chartae]
MRAGHLEVGDKIKKADGTTGVVKYVNMVQETRTMYNLDVAVADTFFVGMQTISAYRTAYRAIG